MLINCAGKFVRHALKFNIHISKALGPKNRPKNEYLQFFNLFNSFSTTPFSAECVNKEESKTVAPKECEGESISSMKFKQPQIFLDEETEQSLISPPSKKDSSSNKSEKINIRKKEDANLDEICYQEVKNLINGVVEYRVPDLETLLSALRRSIRLGKTQFTVEYFDGWWRLFQESASQLNEPPPEFTLVYIYMKLGLLNSHTNGLLREFLDHSRLHFLQLLALKGFPAYSSKSICSICQSFEHIFNTEDVKYPWDFFSPQFVNGLVLNLHQKREKTSNKNVKSIDIPYQSVRIAAILAKLHAKIEEDHLQFFMDCIKETMNRNTSIVDYVTKEDFIALANGQRSAAIAMLYWRTECDQEFWQLWFKGVENILSIYETSLTIKQVTDHFASKDPEETPFTTIAFKTIIAELCTMTVFAAMRTDNMQIFSQLKPIWSKSLRNCADNLSYASAQRILNEIEAAESFLLHSNSCETNETTLIDEELRQRLRKKSDEAKERRIKPIILDIEKRKNVQKSYNAFDKPKNPRRPLDYGHGFSSVSASKPLRRGKSEEPLYDDETRENHREQKWNDQHKFENFERKSINNSKNRYLRHKRQYVKDISDIPNEESLKFRHHFGDKDSKMSENTDEYGVPGVLSRRRSVPANFERLSRKADFGGEEQESGFEERIRPSSRDFAFSGRRSNQDDAFETKSDSFWSTTREKDGLKGQRDFKSDANFDKFDKNLGKFDEKFDDEDDFGSLARKKFSRRAPKSRLRNSRENKNNEVSFNDEEFL